MIKKVFKNNSQSGFTLLEMTVVVILAGVILALIGASMLTYTSANKKKTTEVRTDKIRDALAVYLSTNGRYPCVARWDLGVDHPNFGRQIANSCNDAVVAGTQDSGLVRLGAVPTRSLNLPDEYAADGWGRKFTFAVTKRLATPALYRSDAGRIIIRDEAGNDILSGINGAHYVIVSHGATGIGSRAFSRENAGTANVTVPCAAAGRDQENCDNDRIFISTLVNNSNNNAEFFDDYVFYKGLWIQGLSKDQTIPPGAVMPFNQATCPAGWTRYFLAERSFIMGSGVPQSIPQDPIVPAPTDEQFSKTRYTMQPESSENINVGLRDQFPGAHPISQTADGDGQKGNMPPYVALLYCEKLPD